MPSSFVPNNAPKKLFNTDRSDKPKTRGVYDQMPFKFSSDQIKKSKEKEKNKKDKHSEHNMSHLTSANTTMEWGLIANPEKMKAGDPKLKLKRVDTSQAALNAVDGASFIESDSSDSPKKSKSKDKKRKSSPRRKSSDSGKIKVKEKEKNSKKSLLPQDTDTETDKEKKMHRISHLFKSDTKKDNKSHKSKRKDSDREKKKKRKRSSSSDKKSKKSKKSKHSKHSKHSKKSTKSKGSKSTVDKKNLTKTIFEEFEEIDTSKLSKEDLNLMKMEAIYDLAEYQKIGIPLSQKYGKESDLNAMRKELFMIRLNRDRENTISLWENVLGTAANLAVYANTHYNPFAFNLKTWPKRLRENKASFRDIYHDLYEKHRDKNGRLAPEFRFVMALVGSAVETHTESSQDTDERDREKKIDQLVEKRMSKYKKRLIKMQESQNQMVNYFTNTMQNQQRQYMHHMQQQEQYNRNNQQQYEQQHNRNRQSQGRNFYPPQTDPRIIRQRQQQMQYSQQYPQYPRQTKRSEERHNKKKKKIDLNKLFSDTDSDEEHTKKKRKKSEKKKTKGDDSDTSSELVLKPKNKKSKSETRKKSKNRSKSNKSKSSKKSKSDRGIMTVKTERYDSSDD